MAFEGLRSKLRSLADSGSDTAREVAEETPERVREVSGRARQAGASATGAVAKRAPATDLEGRRKPAQPGTREAIARRLQSSGEMRKPIQDATLEPGADPRFMEEFARGDADTGEWFGESRPARDANAEFFGGSGETVGTRGTFAGELVDERDHEGGMYAYEDEHEEGWLDDGIDTESFAGGRFRW